MHTVIDAFDVSDRAYFPIFRFELGQFVGKRVDPRYGTVFLTDPQTSVVGLKQTERAARHAVFPHFELHVGREGVALAFPQSVVLGREPDVSLGVLCHTVDILDFAAQQDSMNVLVLHVRFHQAFPECTQPDDGVLSVYHQFGNTILDERVVHEIVERKFRDMERSLDIVRMGESDTQNGMRSSRNQRRIILQVDVFHIQVFQSFIGIAQHSQFVRFRSVTIRTVPFGTDPKGSVEHLELGNVLGCIQSLIIQELLLLCFQVEDSDLVRFVQGIERVPSALQAQEFAIGLHDHLRCDSNSVIVPLVVQAYNASRCDTIQGRIGQTDIGNICEESVLGAFQRQVETCFLVKACYFLQPVLLEPEQAVLFHLIDAFYGTRTIFRQVIVMEVDTIIPSDTHIRSQP